ncbi:hypothetical protein GCM10011404_34300 [Sphingomonas prati]|nr:hypothetical protein GCM10011404_34300 [Sphingomonas prati]
MVFLAQVCYFTIMDPDRLQNEKHVEQKMMISRKINVIEDGKVSEILLPRHEQVIQNPGLEDRS